MILTFIHGHSCMRNFFFAEILQSIWMKFSMLPHPVGLLKLILNLVCTSQIQIDFVKHTFNIVLCEDTRESICFKLGVLNTTKFCLNDLNVHSRSQGYGKA